MDVVYPYKATDDDFELRYSLRSLINVPHDRVIVAGDRPMVTGRNVVHVPVEPSDHRYQSSTRNIVAAVREVGVTGDFIVIHDDMFVMRTWAFKHEHRGTIAEYLASGKANGQYRAHIEATRSLLVAAGVHDPLWFGLHTPTVYNAEKLLSLVGRFSGQQYLLRTLYHSLYPQPSTTRDDVKVHQWGAALADDIVSVSDEAARTFGFRQWAARQWPERSKYEISSDGRCLILGYGKTLWQDVDRALRRGEYAAVISSPEAAEHWPEPVMAIAENDYHADRIARACGFDDVVWCGRSVGAK